MRLAYEKRILSLPRGSLVVRDLNENKYCYLRYREGNKVIQKYVNTIEQEKVLRAKINEINHLKKLINILNEVNKIIKKTNDGVI